MPGNRPSSETIETWRALLAYVRRATALLDAELQRERGMHLEAYDVLYQVSVGPAEGMRMTALAGALLVAPSSCTRLVAGLAERGWLARTADPADGRAVVVSLTSAGRAALRRASAVHVRGIERVFGSKLDEATLLELAAVLGRLG